MRSPFRIARKQNPPTILLISKRTRLEFGRDSNDGKTGRFGPIGPETAQCQLPHNIVTFGMVRNEKRLCVMNVDVKKKRLSLL